VSHDVMQGCHIENAVAVEVHDNDAGKIHRVGDDQVEAHEIDMSQNVAAAAAVVVVADPNEMPPRRCYWILDDDPIANDLVVVARVLEEVVHESCSIAVTRDNIL